MRRAWVLIAVLLSGCALMKAESYRRFGEGEALYAQAHSQYSWQACLTHALELSEKPTEYCGTAPPNTVTVTRTPDAVPASQTVIGIGGSNLPIPLPF